jgi:lipopolysaccharide biosynthesis protein
MRSLAGRFLDLLTYLELVIPGYPRADFVVYQKSKMLTSPYVAVVAIFEAAGEIDYELIKTLNYLRSLNYEVVIVANIFPNQSVLKLFSKDFTLIIRPNLGRDFGAYKAGLEWTTKDHFRNPLQKLILFNDSISWTPAGMRICIQRAESSPVDILGVTTSRQRTLHIQSYFYFVKDGAIGLFVEKFLQLKDVRFKRSIINLGERKFSRMLIRSGLLFEAIFSENELYGARQSNDQEVGTRQFRQKPLNTAIHYSKELQELGKGIKKKNHKL